MCRVSVIVPTHNRAAFLADQLDRMLRQSYPDCETIYVDDASTDGTAALLDRYARQFPGRLRVVTVTFGAPGPARNAGAAIARGELLLFADDDIRMSEDWVERMVECYDANDRAAICGGIMPVSMETDIERYLHYRVIGSLGHARANIEAAPMMNFLVSRDAFEKAGGFLDTPLRAAEDWEFCRRLRAAGTKIVFNPRVSVAHTYQRERGPALERLRDAGAAGVYIWLRYHRGALLYTMYSLARCALSPLWAPCRYPLDLFALAVRMECVFAGARLRAYLRHLRGENII